MITIVARGLIAAYVVIALTALFPLQPLDPGWQQRLIATLLNNAPLPLSATALLWLTHYLPLLRKQQHAPFQEPDQPIEPTATELRLWRLQRQCRIAAVGFFLLLLLQVLVSVRQLNQVDRSIAQRNKQLTTELKAASQALNTSLPADQLNRIAALVVPPPELERFQALSLAERQAQLRARISRTGREATQQLNRLRTGTYTTVAVEAFRNIALALIFGLAFRSIRFSPQP